MESEFVHSKCLARKKKSQKKFHRQKKNVLTEKGGNPV
jgi:hypothetical protein